MVFITLHVSQVQDANKSWTLHSGPLENVVCIITVVLLVKKLHMVMYSTGSDHAPIGTCVRADCY